MPRPPRAIVGDLVAQLLAAKEHQLEAGRAVTEVLESLLPDWRPKFPTSLGWHWTPARGDVGPRIDIYEAIDSPAAAQALHLAGFQIVVLHGHRADQFPTCACSRHTR